MRASVYLAITVSIILALLAACAPAAPTAPTAAPTKPPAAPTAAPATPAAPAVTAANPTAAPKPAAPTAAAAPKVKRGGTLRHSKSWTYPTFDPHLVTVPSMPGQRVLFDAPLLNEYNEKTQAFEIKPELFESWSFPDPTTAVFKVRKGVKFHDGTELNGEVARFNIDRMINHKKSYAKVYFEGVKSAERVDDDTVKINLKAPTASLLAMLTGSTGPVGIVSQAAVEKLGDDAFGWKPVGSGPFVFSDWVSDDRLTVKRFDGYWRQGVDGKPLPYLDGIVFRFIPDNAIAVVELRAGGIDIMENADPKDAATIKADPNLTLVELPWSGTIYFTGGTNTKNGVFASNLKLRQALAHAIDRDSMAKAVTFGMGQAHLHPYWGPGIVGYDSSVKAYPYDPAKAKQLMAEAGYPNGLNITLSVIARQPEQRLSEIAKQMFDQVGFRTTIDALERLAFNAKLQSYNFELGFWRPGLPLDPDQNTRYLYTGGGGNWSGFSDPEVDKCMDEGRSTMDAAKRHEVYKRCLTIVQENAYLFTGYNIRENYAANKSVKSIRYQHVLMDLREAWLDK
ncbi:MAG: ABC transporter substrate-binding protein [Chloroflexi bacterium]|nr:ABC transporter substrate-binding protein [Chloroflexota bacterium]